MKVRHQPDPERVSRLSMGAGVGVLLAFTLLAALMISPVLIQPTRVLDFNDGNIETALAPAFSLPGALLRVWDNQTFFGLGGKQYALCSASIGEWLFGPHHYRREAMVVLLGFIGGAVFWMLRQFGIGRMAAALAGGAVMLSGAVFSFAVLGLAVRGTALGFAALALGFLERGRRSGRLTPYGLAGGCLGLTIAETPDIGVFFALTLAGIYLWLHWPANRLSLPAWRAVVLRFALFVSTSVILSLQTLVVMLTTQVHGVQQGASESAEARYDWATQWSLPPEETWNLVAGTFYGTSMRSTRAPYRGRIGRTPGWSPDAPQRGFRNFALTGYHLGVIPSILLLASWIAMPRLSPERRRLAGLSMIGALLCLLFAWGRYTPAYRLLYSLPYLGTIRNPEKWLMPFMLFVSVGLGLALDSVRHAMASSNPSASSGMTNAFLRAALIIAGGALLTLLGTLLGQDSFRATMSREGYVAAQIDAAWHTAMTASLRVLLVSALVAALVWILHRSPQRISRFITPSSALFSILAMVGTFDLFLVNRHYVAGRDYQHILEPNPLTSFVRQHHNTGRFKLLPPEHPALNHLRMSYLQLTGCDLFDPVSVSRLPTGYASLFQALRSHPDRIWAMGAVRFFITLRGGPEQLEQLDGNRGRFRDIWGCGLTQTPEGALRPIFDAPAEEQFLRIVEFTAARPKWFFPSRLRTVSPEAPSVDTMLLAQLLAPDFDPLSDTVVATSDLLPTVGADAKIVRVLRDEPAFCEIEVETPAPTLLVRAVCYDPDWRVLVGGQPAPLLRADFLMQAVVVPGGRHRVAWEYRPSRAPLYAAIAGRAAWLVVWLFWLLRGRAHSATPSSATLSC